MIRIKIAEYPHKTVYVDVESPKVAQRFINAKLMELWVKAEDNREKISMYLSRDAELEKSVSEIEYEVNALIYGLNTNIVDIRIYEVCMLLRLKDGFGIPNKTFVDVLGWSYDKVVDLIEGRIIGDSDLIEPLTEYLRSEIYGDLDVHWGVKTVAYNRQNEKKLVLPKVKGRYFLSFKEAWDYANGEREAVRWLDSVKIVLGNPCDQSEDGDDLSWEVNR